MQRPKLLVFTSAIAGVTVAEPEAMENPTLARRVLFATLICILLSANALAAPSRARRASPLRVLDRARLLDKNVAFALRRYRTAKSGASKADRYRRLTDALAKKDIALGRTLASLGLIKPQPEHVERQYDQLMSVVRGVATAESLARDRVIAPYYRQLTRKTKNPKVKPSKRAAERARSVLAIYARGLSDLDSKQRRAVVTLAEKRIDLALGQVKSKIPQIAGLRPGSKRWFQKLAHYTGSTPQRFDSSEVFADSPSWRKNVFSQVANAKGHLFMSALFWYDDKEGRELATAVTARKLGMSAERLTARLNSGQSIAQIRDRRLASTLVKSRKISRRRAKAIVTRLSEKKRAALANKLLGDGLDVRISLSLMAQFRLMRGNPRSEPLQMIESVGGQVIFDKSPILPGPKLALQNLWSVVPHAKFVLTQGEVSFGGFNIGHTYLKEKAPLPWHDAGARFSGPLADAQLKNYVRHWNRAAKERKLDVS
jgi:hypothetical protein